MHFTSVLVLAILMHGNVGGTKVTQMASVRNMYITETILQSTRDHKLTSHRMTLGSDCLSSSCNELSLHALMHLLTSLMKSALASRLELSLNQAEY